MFINLYGLGDNFLLFGLYLLLVFICCYDEVKVSGVFNVINWGIGMFWWELLYVDDLVSVCLYLLEYFDGLIYVNVGIGIDYIIGEIVEMVVLVVGYSGEICWDLSKLDGILCKLLDVLVLWEVGWWFLIVLCDGIEVMVVWYCEYVGMVW